MSAREKIDKLTAVLQHIISLFRFIAVILIVLPLMLIWGDNLMERLQNINWPNTQSKEAFVPAPTEVFWTSPDIDTIIDLASRSQILYGKELIAHTAKYLGPNGIVSAMSNGMNCQNCHLEAGTKTFGNNYSGVASTYPKFRARSGGMEDIYKRVNDCFIRSLNGKALDTLSKEMQAIKAYINFLGTNVEKGVKPNGAGLKDLAYLSREASPEKGSLVYIHKCASCHMGDGRGQKTPDGIEYLYPPLWGQSSFNDGAGLFRLSNFAKYVKYNMPQGASHRYPVLTDEEAWDVAAFVLSQRRPHLDVPNDWPDVTKKPIDHPYGPYADSFSESQHKYGPYQPILAFVNQQESKPKQ